MGNTVKEINILVVTYHIRFVSFFQSQTKMQCSTSCGTPPIVCGAFFALFFVISMMVCLQQINSDSQVPQPQAVYAKRESK
jgi:hypothetical protein